MSHELRTPLNSILGFSDVLAAAANLDDRQHRYVSNIQSSGQSLLTMINDVLDLAKIESGRMEVHAVEFSLGDLIDRLVNSIAPLAEKKNIDVVSAFDPDCPLLFQDIGKLEQILLNLLSNAIKFTPEGGRVRVSGQSHDARQVDLLVEDNGVGIPLDDQEAIFEKFRQGSGLPGQQDAMTREYGGTGLGLSIVKELTRLLGGSVILESEFGKGSTFTIRIPVQHTDPVEVRARSLLRESSGRTPPHLRLTSSATGQPVTSPARSTAEIIPVLDLMRGRVVRGIAGQREVIPADHQPAGRLVRSAPNRRRLRRPTGPRPHLPRRP
ncbi:MAG: hypothetical protein CM1200mP2_33340 [Planctomycetaceae bacterium]|nr:MAG: hypothetical protein CM1200mP2_33340 [Planctomycetaceae bacterium]